jgi:hypothetical protein
VAFLWRGSKGFLPIFVCFLVIQTLASAQTANEGNSVSILFMTFSGDNRADANQLGSAMRTELEWISRASGYTIKESSNTLKTQPAINELSSADQAHNPKYLINGIISREGGVSVADISLWALEEPPALIFSQGFEYQSIDDALPMIPFYSWSIYAILPVLERIPQEPAAAGENAEAAIADTQKAGDESPAPSIYIVDKVWQSRWLYLGLKVGISPRFYLMDITDKKEFGFTWEAAFQAECQFFRFPWGRRNVFFALQGEIVFTMDRFNFPDAEGTMQEKNLFSIMAPVLLKVNYKPGPFVLGFYGGMYYIGYIHTNSADEGAGQWAIRRGDPPSFLDFLGYSFGFKFGVKVGKRGTAFFDLRYSSDLGVTEIEFIQPTEPVSYRRNTSSLTLGYEVGLFNRKQ